MCWDARSGCPPPLPMNVDATKNAALPKRSAETANPSSARKATMRSLEAAARRTARPTPGSVFAGTQEAREVTEEASQMALLDGLGAPRRAAAKCGLVRAHRFWREPRRFDPCSPLKEGAHAEHPERTTPWARWRQHRLDDIAGLSGQNFVAYLAERADTPQPDMDPGRISCSYLRSALAVQKLLLRP